MKDDLQTCYPVQSKTQPKTVSIQASSADKLLINVASIKIKRMMGTELPYAVGEILRSLDSENNLGRGVECGLKPDRPVRAGDGEGSHMQSCRN